MPGRRAFMAAVLLLASSGAFAPVRAQTPPAGAGPVYVAYYWRARPDKIADYSTYITGTAEAIDENARQAGAFIEVRTVLATRPADGPPPEWTHLRIFTLKDMAAADALGTALEAATARAVPDEIAHAGRSRRVRLALRLVRHGARFGRPCADADA